LAVDARPELSGKHFNWNGAELADYQS
jgi:hypothetical protein